MGFQLAPSAIEAGYRLETFPSVGSTNAMALERAHAGEAGPLWIVSKKQEAGRGPRRPGRGTRGSNNRSTRGA
jgi:BirA family transcriptional regulator, biotin operon repressor / biotin---[acetyl-CoA-carboxylase] ligase